MVIICAGNGRCSFNRGRLLWSIISRATLPLYELAVKLARYDVIDHLRTLTRLCHGCLPLLYMGCPNRPQSARGIQSALIRHIIGCDIMDHRGIYERRNLGLILYNQRGHSSALARHGLPSANIRYRRVFLQTDPLLAH